MTKRWVVNASPLILLGKTENLHLVSALAGSVAVPRSVMREVGVKPDGVAILRAMEQIPAFHVVEDVTASALVLSWDLGAGETQVIANAELNGAARVVIDDREARRCAAAMGLRIIGTLGVVGRAKAGGQIDEAGPVIERLRKTGLYISEAIVQRFLREVGE